MKFPIVPRTTAMTEALARLDEARRAMEKGRGRSPGQFLRVIEGETPVQSVGGLSAGEEDPAPGREDTDVPAALEGSGNARKAGVFTSGCKE